MAQVFNAQVIGLCLHRLKTGATHCAKRNFLIVGGTSSARRLASETVQIFDVEPMARQNFSLLSLKQADARVVAAELEKIFGDDQTGQYQ